MNVVIVGCGRMGSTLAYKLHQAGHAVTVVDSNGPSFRNLHPEFRGRTVEGEVLAEDTLRRAAVDQADGLAAVTNSDSVNAVVAHVARVVFRVPKVVVRNYDPRWLALHEAFGHEVVSSTGWGASQVEGLLTAGGR